jgi:hypothetical protein
MELFFVVLGSGCPSCAMGNKLSCSCAPLMRKAYRYEDSPWQTGRRRDGHLLRFNNNNNFFELDFNSQ